MQTAHADPSGAPTYRALAGGGSATTDALMNALAEKVTVNGQKVLSSYDAARPGLTSTITTKANCTVNRPAGDASGQMALGNSVAWGDGCLDFARLAGEPHQQSIAPVKDVTYLPFAVDGITFAMNTSKNLYGPSLTYLRGVYTCGSTPGITLHPLLPASGSQLRSEWLAALGIREEDVSGGKYPCVKDTNAGQPIRENDVAPVAADPDAIMPVSIGRYVAEGWPNVRIGNIRSVPESDGRGPVVPDTEVFPGGVGYAIHRGQLRDLSLDELRSIYQCSTSYIDGKWVTPVLPGPSLVRSWWLQTMEMSEADIEAGQYPCLRLWRPDDSPPPVDDGFGIAEHEIVPFSISEYLRQAVVLDESQVVKDKRYGLVLGGLVQGDGVVKRPFVLNSSFGRPLLHRLYNVVPAEKQRATPWREVFTGDTSLICQNTALIETYGFVPLAPEACGGGAQMLSDPTPPSYTIRNARSGKCLEAAGTSNGDPVVQRTCGSAAAQRWSWAGTDKLQLKSANSGKCVATTGDLSGAQAVLAPCGSDTGQQWMSTAGAGSTAVGFKNVRSGKMLTVPGGDTADGVRVVQWTADGSSEQSWTLQTATTASPGEDVLSAPTTLAATTGTGPAATRLTSAATTSEFVAAHYPERMVDVRHGRCRFQGWWRMGAYGKGGASAPIGGTFLYVDGYVDGPKCLVTMEFRGVNYDRRADWLMSTDHWFDASKPTGPGKNERWMFWGPIQGGSYDIKVGNVPYLLNFKLKDLTTTDVSFSTGQVWGPKANWCAGWPPPGSPPGCSA
ncbi:hypothetical protein Psi02_32850 [Planotetraspora silvatica]|uniref:Ricin B lectin domain-containing protein n=1 Tax=Planotetraspora silvatica TaxID=234614 RepID=A0A8J3UP47_9ACTN|nr:RICIN domain-containing protein [Planotetraspora silvatica]GII46861.1 hypothetical protein Psi02_32850 [Planotetraspora silvatica]